MAMADRGESLGARQIPVGHRVDVDPVRLERAGRTSGDDERLPGTKGEQIDRNQAHARVQRQPARDGPGNQPAESRAHAQNWKYRKGDWWPTYITNIAIENSSVSPR